MMTETAQRDETPVLAIKDLRIQIAGLDVVDGVSLMAGKGRILAIVGESGCGKSLTALSICGFCRKPPGLPRAGSSWKERTSRICPKRTWRISEAIKRQSSSRNRLLR